jgi:hypothetical protein
MCACCGQEHAGLPFSFAADFPDSYANLNRDDREARAVIGTDQCIIDQEQFILRGCLEIPVHDAENPIFLWGVWANVWERDFDEISDHWESPGREQKTGPYKGRLANSLSIYPETFNLSLTIQIRPVGERPLFKVDDETHPIALEQRSGITLSRAREYACLLLRIANS